jgi:hypothetical protein
MRRPLHGVDERRGEEREKEVRVWVKRDAYILHTFHPREILLQSNVELTETHSQ